MSEKQQLGPLQTQWVEALESGKWKKGTTALCRVNPITGEKRYCCLGVLCEILGVQKYTSPNGLMVSFGVSRESGVLPRELLDKIKLRTVCGNLPGDSSSGSLGDGALTRINDTSDSFAPVIKAIRDNPELYFTEAV